jgi:hypothetical protein
MMKDLLRRASMALLCLMYVVSLNAAEVKSPNGNVVLNFSIEQGRPVYSVTYKGRDVILPSHLGLELAKDKHASRGEHETDLMDGFTLKKTFQSLTRHGVPFGASRPPFVTTTMSWLPRLNRRQKGLLPSASVSTMTV